MEYIVFVDEQNKLVKERNFLEAEIRELRRVANLGNLDKIRKEITELKCEKNYLKVSLGIQPDK